METYTSFNGLADAEARKAACGSEPQSQMSTFNAPHIPIVDDNDNRIGGIDFYVEYYFRDGIVSSKEVQNEIHRCFQLPTHRNPLYGVIPEGDPKFSAFQGNVCVFEPQGNSQQDRVRICDKDSVNLAGYAALPGGWHTVAQID